MHRWAKVATMLLTGGFLAQTIVCNIPDIRFVTDGYDDDYVIVDRYYDDYYYDDFFFW